MNTVQSGVGNTLVYFTVHQIENEKDIPTKVEIVTDDGEQFTNKLFMQDLNAKNKRGYKFARETSEVGRIITDIVSEIDNPEFLSIFEAKTDLIAERLLDVQKRRIQMSPGIKAPKKGSLVIIFQKLPDRINILISKIEQVLFLSLEEFVYRSGLPDENATQKTCSITYQLEDDEYRLLDIVVTDTKSKISVYWYDDFLELKELTCDESNTLGAFTAIENVLSRYVKRKSKKDYTDLRNLLVGYFQTKKSFRLDEMVEYVVGDYVPESENVNISELKRRLVALPESKGFDSAFNIIASQVKSRFKRSYKISDKIELRTSDYIEDMRNVIIAKEDEDFGEKVLVIKDIDEDIYNTFKR
ncbi:hypothetical protein [Bacillus sp. E214]|uniref:hypothetical protein n=1 Tax=Bacillus sp. E214 TaxID=2587156 RepID=UPI0011E03CBC|nr:hypothetical protein [Bacillus sp. E214]